jgi:hypothetical protein
MPGIFDDERRGRASSWSNPSGTGRLFPPASSRTACVGPATRRSPLLTGGKIRSRHGAILIVNRP